MLGYLTSAEAEGTDPISSAANILAIELSFIN